MPHLTLNNLHVTVYVENVKRGSVMFDFKNSAILISLSFLLSLMVSSTVFSIDVPKVKRKNLSGKISTLEEEVAKSCERNSMNWILCIEKLGQLIELYYESGDYYSGFKSLDIYIEELADRENGETNIRTVVNKLRLILKEKWDTELEFEFDEMEEALLYIADALERHIGYEHGLLSITYKELASYATNAGFSDKEKKYSELAAPVD